jgi:hypothetical protein
MLVNESNQQVLMNIYYYKLYHWIYLIVKFCQKHYNQLTKTTCVLFFVFEMKFSKSP